MAANQTECRNCDYVEMEICPICNKETGAILLDRTLRKTLPRKVINPGRVCDNCREKYLKDGVMLINPVTGSFVILTTEAFQRIFNKCYPSERISFTDEEVINYLIHAPKEGE